MTINYNVTGAERKKLAQTIAEILECDVKYLGVPSCAYQIDYFTVDKNGSLSFDDRADSDEIEQLIEALCERGFEAEVETEEIGLEIQMPKSPLDALALDNLCIAGHDDYPGLPRRLPGLAQEILGPLRPQVAHQMLGHEDADDRFVVDAVVLGHPEIVVDPMPHQLAVVLLHTRAVVADL